MLDIIQHTFSLRMVQKLEVITSYFLQYEFQDENEDE